MTYSSIAVLAILVQLIINQDVIHKHAQKDNIPAEKEYLRFFLSTMVYYVTDALWGIFDMLHMTSILYADTVVYYVAMASAVLLWTRYVITYLDEKSILSRMLLRAGQIFFAFEILFLIVNFFRPVLFTFDENGVYRPGSVRYIALVIQIVFFLLTSVYTFYVMTKTAGAVRRRNRTIAAFGLIMVIFIGWQYFYPYLPMYSAGYLLGFCLLHSFVLEDVKTEYRMELENALKREKEQRKTLGSVRKLAYTDPLTGVKSKHAYAEREDVVDQLIADNVAGEFSVAVMDLNGLKEINDTRGHETGDEYIITACRLICDHFKHSPVYRIGGDEFVVIMIGEDHKNRSEIMKSLGERMEKNAREGKVVIAIGVTDFNPKTDYSLSTVFKRADKMMYQNKKELKNQEPA
ncbi:MAG: GGDEF domain-containing protein [Lachnospiraceae bacterium]|nr:GGDEF domain-containing protein [Lachnospiraceae bacterium]